MRAEAVAPARFTEAFSTPSCRLSTRSTRTAHVAQVIPSTSRRRVWELSEDDVALLLDGLLDRVEADRGLVEGDVESGIGHRYLDAVDTIEIADGPFDARLAV